jgi:hypothetical protein
MFTKCIFVAALRVLTAPLALIASILILDRDLHGSLQVPSLLQKAQQAASRNVKVTALRLSNRSGSGHGGSCRPAVLRDDGLYAVSQARREVVAIRPTRARRNHDRVCRSTRSQLCAHSLSDHHERQKRDDRSAAGARGACIREGLRQSTAVGGRFRTRAVLTRHVVHGSL